MENRKCVACGEEFTPVNSQQKYCKECRENKRTVEYYERAVALNKRNAGDYDKAKVITCQCRVCGKKFLSIGARQSYCSSACLQAHIAETAKCPICGVRLMDKGITSGKGCCSDECREELRRQHAIAAGKYIACENCGKMFISKNYRNVFCCKRCFDEHRRKEKARREQLMQKYQDTHLRQFRRCPVCDKNFEIGPFQKTKKFCSVQCYRKANRQAAAAKKITKKASSRGACGKESLCIGCKTSQKMCERFTSGFQYYPTGAVVQVDAGKQIVVTCPKYRASKNAV